MSWPVYTERFLRHQAQGSWFYTVPVGTRVVIKSFVAVNLADAASYAFLRGNGVVMVIAANLAVNGTLPIATTVALYGGEQLELFISKTGYHCTVSGYSFADPDHASGPPATAGLLPAPNPEPNPPYPTLPPYEEEFELGARHRGSEAGSQQQLPFLAGMRLHEALQGPRKRHLRC